VGCAYLAANCRFAECRRGTERWTRGDWGWERGVISRVVWEFHAEWFEFESAKKV
jgi:hypothetical protein